MAYSEAMLHVLRTYRTLPALLTAAVLLSLAVPLAQQACAGHTGTTHQVVVAPPCCCGASHAVAAHPATCASQQPVAKLEARCCALEAADLPQPAVLSKSIAVDAAPFAGLVHVGTSGQVPISPDVPLHAARPVPAFHASPPLYLFLSVFLR